MRNQSSRVGKLDGERWERGEADRLAALDRYDILDTPPEEPFDRITRLVRTIFNVSMSTIALIDGHRQWFKSRQGVADCETARGPALCDTAISSTRPLIVPDTLLDARFAKNRFVVGAPFIRFYAGVQLRSPDGHAIGTLCAMHDEPRELDDRETALLCDLANMVMTEMELRTLVTRDALTGALARRALREEFSRAVALASRHQHELSCILFDLDHFKAINDGHGHAVGDQVLKVCVEACRKELRTTDAIGRLGGEEFAILLPHTGRDAAFAVAEKIRTALLAIDVESEAGLVRVSASFGIASLEGDGCDVDQMLKRADSALYAAKAIGRNNCQIWLPGQTAQSGSLRRVLKAGQITFNEGRSAIECTVRGLSSTGAVINVISAAAIPDRFTLGVSADELDYMCTVTARRDNQIEVVFD
jgi:diguanylate cyclase (GGDEF)-like protein